MKKRLFIFLLFGSVFFSLTGCFGETKTISEQGLSFGEKDVINGINSGVDYSSIGDKFSVLDSGILFMKDSHLMYYDFDTENSYILCGDAACKHEDNTCVAWYGLFYEIYGAALYREQLYYFQENSKNNTIELVQRDATGTTKKVLAALDKGEYEKDDLLLDSIDWVYYAGDKVWFLANYSYYDIGDLEEGFSVETTVPMSVDLKTSELIYLQSIPEKDEAIASELSYQFEYIDSNTIIYSSSKYQNKRVLKEEFEKNYQNGKFEGVEYDSGNPYADYLYSYYKKDEKKENEYYSYDIKAGETEKFYSSEAVTLYGEDRSVVGWVPEVEFYGVFEEYFFCGRCTEENMNAESFTNKNNNLYLWDRETGEKTTVLDMEIGGIPGSESTMVGGHIDENRFRYVVYTGDGENLEMYFYDLSTGASEKMMDDAKNITFRIVDSTEEYFVGKIYKESFGNVAFDLYKIKKEDYYAGNMNAKVKLKL